MQTGKVVKSTKQVGGHSTAARTAPFGNNADGSGKIGRSKPKLQTKEERSLQLLKPYEDIQSKFMNAYDSENISYVLANCTNARTGDEGRRSNQGDIHRIPVHRASGEEIFVAGAPGTVADTLAASQEGTGNSSDIPLHEHISASRSPTKTREEDVAPGRHMFLSVEAKRNPTVKTQDQLASLLGVKDCIPKKATSSKGMLKSPQDAANLQSATHSQVQLLPECAPVQEVGEYDQEAQQATTTGEQAREVNPLVIQGKEEAPPKQVTRTSYSAFVVSELIDERARHTDNPRRQQLVEEMAQRLRAKACSREHGSCYQVLAREVGSLSIDARNELSQ